MASWISVIIMALGFISTWLLVGKRLLGWWLVLVAEPLWFTYGLLTNHWGFVLSGTVYSVMAIRAIMRWSHERRLELDCETTVN